VWFVAVFFRMLLGRTKGGRFRHVELNVMPVHSESGSPSRLPSGVAPVTEPK
jgi:hypothetical protein